MADTAGALLLRHAVVRPEQITAAHQLRKKDGGSFGECLIRIGAIDENALVEFYHKRLMIPRLAESKLMIVAPKVLGLVPADMATEFRIIPVELDRDGTLTLAMADPTDNHAVDEVTFFADRFVLRAAASESAVRIAIETHYRLHFNSPRVSDRVAAAPQDARPARAEPEEPVVLLTKVKRSELTPLPAPLPPKPEEPILLSRAKHDTVQDLPTQAPEPPIAGLKAARVRDDIARLLLDYVGALAGRAIFFVVKKQLLCAFDVRGESAPGALQDLTIDIQTPSIFRDVITSRLPYRGPLPGTPANRAFADALAGVSDEILVMPIGIRDRIIAVLYADRGATPLPDGALHATVREAGLAYERLILSAKAG